MKYFYQRSSRLRGNWIDGVKTRRLRKIIQLAFLAAATPLIANAGDITVTGSIGVRTTKYTITGLQPEEHVNIFSVTSPQGSPSESDAKVTGGNADSSGTLSISISQLLSTGNLPAGHDMAVEPDHSPFTNFKLEPCPKPTFWERIFSFSLLSFTAPSKIEDTELAASGFVPSSLALVSVSANAILLGEHTMFDPTTDTIFTVGTFQGTDLGPVFGTYHVEGTFYNLVDESGQQLAPTFDAFDFTVQIGSFTTVPEPSSLLLVLTACGGLVLLTRRQNKATMWE